MFEFLKKGNIFTCTSCTKNSIEFHILIKDVGNVCLLCYETKYNHKTHEAIEDNILKKIIQVIIIPCRFRRYGCTEKIYFFQKNSHEYECKNRVMLCPFAENGVCKDLVKLKNFLTHIEDEHVQYRIKLERNYLQLENYEKERHSIYLLIFKNCRFILQSKVELETNIVKHKLFTPFEEPQKLKKFSIQHTDWKNKSISFKSNIEYLEENDANNIITIDLAMLKNVLDFSQEVKIALQIDSDGFEFSKRCIKNCECSFCNHMMRPPIFQCPTGHSVCNECKLKFQICKICNQIFLNDTRNFSLEKITSQLLCQCKYENLNCPITGFADEILEHESHCIYRPFKCPVDGCKTADNYNAVLKHMGLNHKNLILESNFSGQLQYTTEDSVHFINPASQPGQLRLLDTRFLLAFGNVFRIRVNRVDNWWYFSVEVIGTDQPSNTFMYKVSINLQNQPLKSLVCYKNCDNEMPHYEIQKHSAAFSKDDLKDFVNKTTFTYSVEISNIIDCKYNSLLENPWQELNLNDSF